MSSLATKKCRWRLLFAAPRAHRWFIDEHTGGISCADDSGTLPGETDDGVLWLDKTRSILLSESEGHKYINTPVTSERTGEDSVISSNIAEMLYLMREHGMELMVESAHIREHFSLQKQKS